MARDSIPKTSRMRPLWAMVLFEKSVTSVKCCGKNGQRYEREYVCRSMMIVRLMLMLSLLSIKGVVMKKMVKDVRKSTCAP